MIFLSFSEFGDLAPVMWERCVLGLDAVLLLVGIALVRQLRCTPRSIRPQGLVWVAGGLLMRSVGGVFSWVAGNVPSEGGRRLHDSALRVVQELWFPLDLLGGVFVGMGVLLIWCERRKRDPGR
jgi:hypothetical protein